MSLAAFRGRDNNTFFIGSDSKVDDSDLDVGSYVYQTAKLTKSLNLTDGAQGVGFPEFANCAQILLKIFFVLSFLSKMLSGGRMMFQSGKGVLACILDRKNCPNGENTTPLNDGFECGHDDDDPELGRRGFSLSE